MDSGLATILLFIICLLALPPIGLVVTYLKTRKMQNEINYLLQQAEKFTSQQRRMEQALESLRREAAAAGRTAEQTATTAVEETVTETAAEPPITPAEETTSPSEPAVEPAVEPAAETWLSSSIKLEEEARESAVGADPAEPGASAEERPYKWGEIDAARRTADKRAGPQQNDEAASETPSTPPATGPSWFDMAWRHFQENWLIWIGGAALLFGMGYLVQTIAYRLDVWPIVRIGLAATLSLAVVAVGILFHRAENPDSVRDFTYVPATITAAGMTGLYGTIVYACLVDNLIIDTSALIMMALVSFITLALTMHLGPLMAIFGLLGGYIAPLLVGGGPPNVPLLWTYITSISVAGLLVDMRVKRPWLMPIITLPNLLWAMTLSSIGWWEPLLFIPLTYYLLGVVPRMGWRIDPAFEDWQRPGTHQPWLVAAVLAAVGYWHLPRIMDENSIPLFLLTVIVVCIPAVRGYAKPAYNISLLMWAAAYLSFAALVELINLTFSTNATVSYLDSILIFTAVLLIWLRMALQIKNGEAGGAFKWALTLFPPLVLGTFMLTIDAFDRANGWIWELYAAVSIAYAFFISRLLPDMKHKLAATAHLLLACILISRLDAGWITIGLAAQVALAAAQIRTRRFAPAPWVVRILVGGLLFHFTMLPFISQWQTDIGRLLSWSLLTYTIAIALLFAARSLLSKHELQAWLDGALLHTIAVFVLTESHYRLTGSYFTFRTIDFSGLSLIALQTAVLAAIYRWRMPTVDNNRLHTVYQLYALLLTAGAGLSIFLLGTFFSPLFNASTDVAGLTVLFNWLTVAFLLPALVLLYQAETDLVPEPFTRAIYQLATLGLLAVWINLSIRYFWQPDTILLTKTTSTAELYTYSLVWLLLGIGMTVIGAAVRRTGWQKTGLIILMVVSAKVFLIDTAGLDGILRALSFLGLGASLVGLGWWFQRLQRQRG